MSLEWLEDWWPAALILFGGYLIFKASKDRAESAVSRDQSYDDGE